MKPKVIISPQEIERKLSLNKQPIHAIVVQAMTEGRQLVIMDDADQRMQHWCIHKTSIVIGIVNLQNIPHCREQRYEVFLAIRCIFTFFVSLIEEKGKKNEKEFVSLTPQLRIRP